MNQAAAAKGFAGFSRLLGSGVLFRAARTLLVILIIVLPLEAVTAAREAAMIGAAFFLAAHLFLSGDSRFRPTVLFWPLVFYTAVAALSLVWAVDYAYSLRELRAEVLKGLIIFYLGVHFVREQEHLKQAWAALLVGAALMTAFGVFLFFWFGGSLLVHHVRAGSLHSGYGAFGAYLVTVWPFILLAPLAFENRARKACLALAGLTAFCAYLTFGRATWGGMLVETGLCIIMLSKRRARAALAGVAAAALAAGALFMVPGATHGERWSQLLKDPGKIGGTAGDLADLWRHSFRHIAEQPFRGIGLGRHSFSKAFPEFRRTHQPLLWHAHNMFVEAALQMGLQGLAALLVLMVVIVWSLWPKAPPANGSREGLFKGAAAIMVVGFAVRNMTDDFFVDDSALMFWLLAGLAMGAGYLKRRQTSGRPE